MAGRAFDSYKDENGIVSFTINPETGACIRATVSAKRGDDRSFTYFGSDSSEPFLATPDEREEWARAKLGEFVDKWRP